MNKEKVLDEIFESDTQGILNTPNYLTEDILELILPHGSGIDCDWEFTEHKNGHITCKNYYHAMNENGYYGGYMQFKFVVYLDNGKPTYNKIICNENARVSFYGLTDYLEDTICQTLSEYNVKLTYNK